MKIRVKDIAKGSAVGSLVSSAGLMLFQANPIEATAVLLQGLIHMLDLKTGKPQEFFSTKIKTVPSLIVSVASAMLGQARVEANTLSCPNKWKLGLTLAGATLYPLYKERDAAISWIKSFSAQKPAKKEGRATLVSLKETPAPSAPSANSFETLKQSSDKSSLAVNPSKMMKV